MWQDFVLVHRPSKQPFASLVQTDDDALLWSTCLRQLLFLPTPSVLDKQDLLPSDQILRGEEAYRLALEICCGLHSPILGETEVFGQFREFFLKLPNSDPFRKFLRSFAEQAIADTKQVRQHQLLNLGAQSYGSLLRRHLESSSSIAILGAGQLTEELLPWFSNKKVHIVCRRPEQGLELTKQFAVEVHGFMSELPSVDAIIVAAPMPREAFEKWFVQQRNPRNLLVDLRGESAVDPLHFKEAPFATLSLDELFQSMARQRAAQVQRSDQAKEEIAKRSERFWTSLHRQVEHRPFGWEDACC